MAARTTTAPGDWSSTGTWTGGVVPGNGDTVTLNHAVTVSDARTVGVSPAAGAGTNAIRCNAALTIASTGNLKVRGDIGLNNVPLNIDGGGILEFDASAAGTPSTARYRCFGINASDPLAIITVTGSSGAHAIIRSNAGGANGRFLDNGNDRSGLFNATFCDFTRIGDASNPAIAFIMASADSFSLVDCVFDACGSIGDPAGVDSVATSKFTLTRVRMINSVGDSCRLPLATRSGSGIRAMTFCDFDKLVFFGKTGGFTVEDTIFRGAYDSGGGKCDSWKRNVIAQDTSTNDLGVFGTWQDTYCVRTGQPSNPHYLTSFDETDRVTGCIFDCPDGNGGEGSGDCVGLNNPSSPKTITVDHNIVLHKNNGNVGTPVTCGGGANLTVVVEHNTYHGGQGAYFGEGYAGHANMVSSFKSNLAYAKAGGTALIIHGEVGVATNVVSAANCIKNGVWNPSGTGYEGTLSFSPGTPGAGDVQGNPSFVDVDRNIKTWDSSLGGPGTIANALDQIGLGNRTVQALLDYVRAGFAPANAAFQAAHDNVSPSNGWMGAVAGASVAPIVSQVPRQPRRHQQRSRLLSYDLPPQAAALAGTANLAITATADLTTGIALAAQATVAVTASCALSTSIPLVAQATVAITGTAALSTGIALAAQATVAVTASASLTTAIPLSGTATVAVTATAALGTSIALQATAALAVTGSAALTTAIALQAAATVAITGTASLDGAAAALAGTASLAVTGSAALTTAIPIAGTANLAITATVGLTTVIALQGSAGLAVTATGSLTTGIALAGAASLVITGTAQLAGTAAALAGTATVAVSATAALSTAILFGGAASLTVGATASLVTAIRFQGSALLQIIGTANLTAVGGIELVRLTGFRLIPAGLRSVRLRPAGLQNIRLRED